MTQTNRESISHDEFKDYITRIIGSLKVYEKTVPNFKFESIITFARGGLPPATYIANALGINKENFYVVTSNDASSFDHEEFRKLVRKKSTLIIDDILDTCRTLQGFFEELETALFDAECKFAFLSIKEHDPGDNPHLLAIRGEIIERTVGLSNSCKVDRDVWIKFPWEVTEDE